MPSHPTSGMSIGIEIETCCAQQAKSLLCESLEYFNCVSDSSIECEPGMSPVEYVLKDEYSIGTERGIWDDIHRSGAIFQDIRMIIDNCMECANESCGVHVHVSYAGGDDEIDRSRRLRAETRNRPNRSRTINMYDDPMFIMFWNDEWVRKRQTDMCDQYDLRADNEYCEMNEALMSNNKNVSIDTRASLSLSSYEINQDIYNYNKYFDDRYVQMNLTNINPAKNDGQWHAEFRGAGDMFSLRSDPIVSTAAGTNVGVAARTRGSLKANMIINVLRQYITDLCVFFKDTWRAYVAKKWDIYEEFAHLLSILKTEPEMYYQTVKHADRGLVPDMRMLEAVVSRGSNIDEAKNIAELIVEENGAMLNHLSDEMKKCPGVVLAAVRDDPRSLELAHDDLKNDEEFVVKAVFWLPETLAWAGRNMRNNKNVVMKAVNVNGMALRYASDRLKNDKNVVMTAIKRDAGALINASDDLKDDEVVVMAAIKQYGDLLVYASDRLKNDKNVVMTAIKQDADALISASDDLKDDEAVVLAAIKKYGNSDDAFPMSHLEYASDRLRNNKGVVMAAVKQQGSALKHASDDLKDDEVVVMAAIKQYGDFLRYASDRLKNDKNVVMTAIKQGADALTYASDRLKNDKDVVMAAVKQMQPL